MSDSFYFNCFEMQGFLLLLFQRLKH